MGPKLKNVNKKASQQTKSKKSYLAEDENFHSFSDQLKRLGLELRDVTGDGNCCFRALSDQMEGNESLHMDLRRQVCQYMRNNKDEFEPFVAALIEEDDDEASNNKKTANKKLDAFEKYVRNLEQSGTYADNGCLVAFARLFQLDINIHQMDMPTWTINGFINPKVNQQVRQLHLAYHNQEHYSSIRPLGDTAHKATSFYMIPNQIAQKSKEKTGKSQNASSSKPSTASNYVYYQDEYENDEYFDEETQLASSLIDQNFELNEKTEQIIEITKCMNIDLIKQKLTENRNDVEATVSCILSQNVSETNRDSDEQKNSKNESKTTSKANKTMKKREKKERQMERQRTKVLEQREKELLAKSTPTKDIKNTKQSDESAALRQQQLPNDDQDALNLALMANMETKAI